ncbi:TRAP transporter substrate-binding protein [Variovorax ureilyticus]|uniref:TRAP transporter substrate-binding protein n=1 Tax=Variovorax ureilyticus TaxID=1836198 RepID=A0ABU8VPE9_9BURK
MTISRRKLIQATVAVGAGIGAPSLVFGQSQFRLKFANIMPVDHPLNVRMTEASAQIKQMTNGQVDIQVFPASQLGTDADMLAQVRSGGIDLFAQTGLILATLVPVAAINGIGFAFSDYPTVWKTMDGALGKHVIKAFEKANLVAFDKMWDNGFRQTLSVSKPIRTPDDLNGFKIRVPPSPLWTAMFKSIGASPVSIPWGETYSALQTKVADGLENPLAGIYYAKMHEVGKYLSTTNHMWDGFWMLANRRSFEAMPPATREIITKVVNEAALKERADVEKLNVDLKSQLAAKGLQFVDVKPEAFRQKLQQSGFYADWKKRLGDEAWGLLEATTTKLA